MNYLGHQDTTALTPIEQQVPLSGILYGDVIDSHCHLHEFLQDKKGLEVQGLRKTVYKYGLIQNGFLLLFPGRSSVS